MIKKDSLSWVDGISEFSYKEDLLTLTFKGECDFFGLGSSDILTDTLFNTMFDQMKKSKGYNFSNMEKQVISAMLSDMVFENDMFSLFAAWDLEDCTADTDKPIQWLGPDNANISISYLPIQETIINQFTDRAVKSDLHVFLLNRASQKIVMGDEVRHFDAHAMRGFYMHSANLIVCDLTLLDDSKCLVHELLHAVIHSLRSYLDDAMYDQGADQREEICVHFATDGYERLQFIHQNFGKYKFERAASEVDEGKDYVTISGKKAKTLFPTLSFKTREFNHLVNSKAMVTQADANILSKFSRTYYASGRSGSTTAVAERRASFNSLELSEPLKNKLSSIKRDAIQNRKLWRYKK